MQPYICKLQFRIVVSNASLIEQFEEQLIVVYGDSREEAYQNGLNAGKQTEDEFVNENQNYVRWELIGITHLFQLNSMQEGAVLFSELRDDYSDQQQQVINNRINRLQQQFTALSNSEVQ
ncbi:MAG: DUF4288 domain-containing protein [Bacteroidota bacterium]